MEELRRVFVADRGSPRWRRELFEGLSDFRSGVRAASPNAGFWVWGCFFSNHRDPMWGENAECIDAVVFLPEIDVSSGMVGVIGAYIEAGKVGFGIDARAVYPLRSDHDNYLEVVAKTERHRVHASLGFSDHATKTQVPCGFVAVTP